MYTLGIEKKELLFRYDCVIVVGGVGFFLDRNE